MTRLLLLCPGQGGQHPAMFDLPRSNAKAAAFLDQCPPLEGDLFANRTAQPAIVAATLAMWIALGEMRPALVAGYSIGELSAYAVAGALAPREAVKLAATRAALMDACATPPQAMIAVSGASAAPAGFEKAIITGHDTFIAGGLEADLQPSYQRLPVHVASHTHWMQAAVAPFAAQLSGIEAPRCPVLAGISAELVESRERAITTLSEQLARTIHWSDCMDAATEAGVTVALELGPGAALSKMMRNRHPHIDCRSVADFRTLDGVARWLDRHAN